MRQVVLAFVLLALVCGAWFWWRSDDAGAPQAPPQATVRAETDAATREAAAARVVEPAVMPEVATADRAPVADAKSIEVRIVDAVTKQPVPGADVRWLGTAAWTRLRALPEREQQAVVFSQHRIALRVGEQTRSDALGVARVAMDANGVEVHATEGSRYGTCTCGAKVPPGGHVLELCQDQTLRVQVLDAHGQPAIGALVRIHFAMAGKSDLNVWSIPAELTRPPDGIAEFAHVQDWLRRDNPEPGATFEWRVALHLPGFADPGVAFDRNALPAEPIVLRLPATARLAARLLHQQQPVTESVGFTAYAGKDEDHGQRYRAQRFVPDEDGWARMPFVPVGVALQLTCRTSDTETRRLVEALPAPDVETRVEFTTEELVVLAGRLLDGEGRPLAGCVVEALFTLTIMGGGARLKTDATGRFLWFAGSVRETRMHKLALVHVPAAGPPLRAIVPPRDLVAGVNDLGTVQLRTEPLVVSGRLQWTPPDERSNARVWVEALASVGGGEEAERWELVEDLPVLQLPDDTFEVRGTARPLRHRLAVSSDNNLPVEPVEFRIGAEGVVIQLAGGARLTATCLLPERLPRDAVGAVLVPPGMVDSKRPAWDRLDRLTANLWGPGDVANEFRWRVLPSGTYTLELRAGVGVLQTIPDVVVPPPAGGDPRLVDIDLRDKLRVVTVRATTTAAPPERGRRRTHAFVEPQTGAGEWAGVTGEGELVVAAPLRAFELLVARTGCQPTRVAVDATQTEVDVVLDPWPTVEFTIADAPALPDGIVWFVSLGDSRPQSQARYRAFWTHPGQRLEDLVRPPRDFPPFVNGNATVPIADGTWRIELSLQRNEGRRSRVLRNVTPTEFVGGPAVAPITLRVSPEEVAAVINELQKPTAGK